MMAFFHPDLGMLVPSFDTSLSFILHLLLLLWKLWLKFISG